MTKKHFIALADYIRDHQRYCAKDDLFTSAQLDTLANFCRNMNPRFIETRWQSYIKGECGKNGGKLKHAA